MVEQILKESGLEKFAGPAGAAVVLIAGVIILKIIVAVLRKALKKSRIDPALHKFIVNMTRILGWVLIAVSVLSELGVNTTTFIAVISAAGAAVALALRDSLANVAGGIIILITKPFGREDYIQIGDAEGCVLDIDIMNTVITTVDEKTVIIPNGTVISSIVTNYSRQGIRRLDFTFEVSYDADIEKVRKVLFETAEGCSYALTDREPVTGVSGHGESGIYVDLKMWTGADDYWPAFYYIQETVKCRFDEEGIEIPYPHMEVRLHND